MAGTRACCPPKQCGQVAPEKEPGSGNHQGPEGASGAERGRATASGSGMDGGGQVQPAGRKRHPTDVSSRSLSRVCVLHIVNRRGSKLSLASKSSSAPEANYSWVRLGGQTKEPATPLWDAPPSDFGLDCEGLGHQSAAEAGVHGRGPAASEPL